MAFNLKGFLSGSARQQQNAALDPGAQFNRALIQYTTSLANAEKKYNELLEEDKTLQQKNKDCIIKETSLRDALDAKKQNLAEVQATCAAQAAENDAQDEILSKLGEEVSAKEQAGCALKAALAEARKGYLKDSAVILNELSELRKFRREA